MKAAVHTRFGGPAVLSISEIEKPTPKDNELLIRVFATTVNRTDCHNLTGLPLFMRFFVGVLKPRISIPGTDFAGQVEGIGRNVKNFSIGDRVMGFEFLGLRSHAQYLTYPADKEIVPIAPNLNFEQAAACIEGAFYALNVIRRVNPQPGQKALVYGATGAIGSSFVQFLKYYGNYVTAVCNGEHRELVKSLGAVKVIDYKKEDFTKDEEKYDFVFDAVGKSTFQKCRPLLTEKGIFSSSGGFENMFLALFTPLMGGKKVIFAPPKDLGSCLAFINELAVAGKFRPVIDRKYPLEKIAEAYTYVMTGRKIGNVIITMDV